MRIGHGDRLLFKRGNQNLDGARFISRAFGVTLRERLNRVNNWAEQQGLELAAECHMDRIQQTINFLVTPKTDDQMDSLGATCYKLNSIQVRKLFFMAFFFLI